MKKPKWMRSSPAKAVKRLSYYIHGGAIAYAPPALLRAKTRNILNGVYRDGISSEIAYRVNYYNKPEVNDELSAGRVRTCDLSFDSSRYRLDLLENLRAFGLNKKINHIFGDITYVPDAPSFVKSRPISDDNSNSIVLKLDKFRHFARYQDSLTLQDKKPCAVWRGGLTNPLRHKLCMAHQHNKTQDIGMVGNAPPEITIKQTMSPQSQMNYRYIVSVEGVDVASNLKWIMSSNSVCISPKMHFETWFMEGVLKSDFHYALVRDDFSDLDTVVARLNANPTEAEYLVSNAQRHAAQFWNFEQESTISTLVIAKYLTQTGQLPDQYFKNTPFDR